MSELVLESSAVFAFIQKEPGHETFSRAVGQSDAAWISAVILAEVLSKLMDNGATLQLAQEGFRLSSVLVLDFDAHVATEAAVCAGGLEHWAFHVATGPPRTCDATAGESADDRSRPGGGGRGAGNRVDARVIAPAARVRDEGDNAPLLARGLMIMGLVR